MKQPHFTDFSHHHLLCMRCVCVCALCRIVILKELHLFENLQLILPYTFMPKLD